jgi:tyrosine-protein phosphatase SIW14
MFSPKSLLRLSVASLALAASVFAADTCSGVGNFYKVNDQVYRGAQPSEQGFQSLAKLGVKTVLDLRETGSRSSSEAKVVEKLGMRYVSLPMRGAGAPTPEQVKKALTLLNDPAAGPVFVHCRRGADRTGTVMACYRISHDSWEQQKALTEARARGMHWFEFAMMKYIMGYKTPPVATAAVATGSAAN